MIKKLPAFFLGIVSLSAVHSAQAHQIWFERAPDQTMTLFYGEFDENALEVTPGGMDRFRALEAERITPNARKKLSLKLLRDRFSVGGKVDNAATYVAVDHQYPIFQNHYEGRDVTEKWTVATRWVGDFHPLKPELELDVVPTGASHDNIVEFQVILRGKPLVGQVVNMESASGWDYAGKTDRNGKVSFTLPWKGQYVMGVEPIISESGVRTGLNGKKEPYDVTGFSTTISFDMAEGLPALPRSPSTLPKSEKVRLHLE